MKIVRNAIVVIAALALVSASLAQGGGQGRRGFGRGMVEPTGMFLLMRKDVSDDLKITDDEKAKLTELRTKAFQDMRANQTSGERPDMASMQKMMTKMMESMSKDVEKILTKDQMTRLHEINVQLAGNQAATFPDVQKDLGLSADQISKIKDLQAKMTEANGSLVQKMMSQDITPEEGQTAMAKNGEALKTEIGKILTDKQRDQLKKMGGKEFKADTSGGL